MAFVRRKRTRRGIVCFCLVENARGGGKVRQRVLAYLGNFPTAERALEELPKEIDRARLRGALARRRPPKAEVAKYQRRLRRSAALLDKLIRLRGPKQLGPECPCAGTNLGTPERGDALPA
jgi:hypothetical protein